MSSVQKVNVDTVARLSVFSHAAVHAGLIHVAGVLGAEPGSLTLVTGGVAQQTQRVLESIAQVLEACGASLSDVIKVNVYLTDMDSFDLMNAVYAEFFGDSPPARITVGVNALALGAAVEMDCVAASPRP